MTPALSLQYHILIHYGEVGLKRKNQPQFRTLLQRNIHQTLKYHGYRAPVRQTRGYLSVDLEHVAVADHKSILTLVRDIFGIIWYTRAVRLRYKIPAGPDLALIRRQISEILLVLAQEKAAPEKSYCVRVRRSDKRFPLKSVDYERELGTFIRENTAFGNADLEHPDCTFYVEIQSGEIYLYREKMPGNQGLPVGSAGRVLVMLSGGIDSPAAAFLIAKRGCKVNFIHFTASHLTTDEALNSKIVRMVARLSRYTLRSRLYLVPYTYFQLALMDRKIPFELVLFRRFMVRVAERIALQSKAKALVTGDNLSQVASQTIWNIASMVSVVDCPVLQPLITYEKREIIDLARAIDTYDISIEPYKDCCSLISRSPNVASKSGDLDLLEKEVFADYRNVIMNSVKDAIRLDFQLGNCIAQSG